MINYKSVLNILTNMHISTYPMMSVSVEHLNKNAHINIANDVYQC